MVWPENTRVETWIQSGLEVTTLYDPMLAKIIVHAKTRKDAIEAMITACRSLSLWRDDKSVLHRSLLHTDAFAEGLVNTNMLNGFQPPSVRY